MQKITIAMLERKTAYLNRITQSPAIRHYWDDNGKYRANIGNYHLDGAYGGYALHRMVNEAGGITDIFNCGHMPKRELAEKIDAFIAGYEAANAA